MLFIKKLSKLTFAIALFSCSNICGEAPLWANYSAPAVNTTVQRNGTHFPFAEVRSSCYHQRIPLASILPPDENEISLIESVISSNVKSFSALCSIYRAARPTAQSLKLVASNGMGTDEIVIRFGIGATRGFDSQLDIYKFGSNNCVPTLSSETDGAEYAINSLPVIEAGTTVNVNLEIPSDGTYTLSITELMNFEDFTAINVYDKLTNTRQNLMVNGTYTFTCIKGASKQRFVLNFQHALITNTAARNDHTEVKISSNSNNMVTISAHNTLSGIADVIVTNILGEEIYKALSVDVSTGVAEIKIENANTSIYIVKAIIDGRTYVREVYLGK